MKATAFLDAQEAPGADEFLDQPTTPTAAEFLDTPYGDPSLPQIGDPAAALDGSDVDADYQQAVAEARGMDRIWRAVRNSEPVTAILGKSAARQAEERALLESAGVDPVDRLRNRMGDEGLSGALLNPFAGQIPRMGPAESNLGKIGAGTVNAAAGLTESLVSPITMLSAGLASGAGVAPGIATVERNAAKLFAADMLGHAPGQVSDAIGAAREGDLQGAVEGGLGAVGSLAFGGAAAKHGFGRLARSASMGRISEGLVNELEGAPMTERPLPITPLREVVDGNPRQRTAPQRYPVRRTEGAFKTEPLEPIPEAPPAVPSAAELATEVRPELAVVKESVTTEPTPTAAESFLDTREVSTVKESLKVDEAPAAALTPESTQARGAETITGRDEEIAPGMPAEREERPDRGPGGFFEAPESVPQQEARLAVEAAVKSKAAARQELIDRANAPLKGGSIDTTGDMLDPTQADNPLFAPRAPRVVPEVPVSTAPEIPVGKPKPKTSRTSRTADRPYSIVDMLNDRPGTKLNLTEFRKDNPDWKPPPSLRKFFKVGSGLSWDKFAHEAYLTGAMKSAPKTVGDMRDAIDDAWHRHKGYGSQERALEAEAVLLGRQASQFGKVVLEQPKPKDAPRKGLPIQSLNHGDTFEAKGHKFVVTKVEANPDLDGEVSSVTVKDGPKFGEQTVHAADAERLYVDPGTYKPAAVAAGGGGGGNMAFSVGSYSSGHPVTLGRVDALRPVQSPELVRLAQDLGMDVRARNLGATRRGVFVGIGPGRIAVTRALFELGNEHQLAATLAHEIGHGVDWAPEGTLRRGNILGRVATLNEFLKTTLPRNPLQGLETILSSKDRQKLRRAAERQAGARPPKDEVADLEAWKEEVSRVYAEKIVEEIEARGLISRDDLHAELLSLSQEWRPLEGMISDAHLAYRMSSREIYADAISVLLNNPGLLEARAPNFYKLFFDYLDRKPAVKEAYLGLQELLSRGEAAVAARQRTATVDGFVTGEQALREALRQDQDAVAHPHGFRARLMQEAVDRGFWIGKEVDRLRARGVRISPDLDPRVAWEEANWADNEHALTSNSVFEAVVRPVTAAGLDLNALGELLKYERIAGGLGARAILQMRLGELGPDAYRTMVGHAEDMARRLARGEHGADILAAMDARGLPSDLIDEIRQNRLDAGTRSEIANPAAESPESVQALLRGLEASMRPEQWQALRGAAEAFRSIIYDKMRQGVEAGIINRHTFDTTITANKSWYATFRGLDHIDEHVTPFIRRAVGSLGDVENPFYTSLLKMLSMNNVMLRNRAKLLARDTFMEHTPESFRRAETYHTGAQLEVRPPVRGLERLEIWENGRRVSYDTDPYIAAAFEQITPAQVGAITKTMDLFWKSIYPFIIKYNPGFQLFTNPIRDFGRTSRNFRAITGRGGKLYMAREYLRAFGTARDFVAGDMNNPTVRAMMEAKAIGMPMEGYGQSAGESTGWNDILERYRIMTPAEQTRFGRVAMAIPHAIQRAGAVFEAIPKVAAFQALTRDLRMTDREAATTIRRYIGTPDFKVKGSHGGVHNVWVPFLNIFLQGYRGDFQLATRPTTRGGYWMQYLMHNGSRAMLIGAATAGVFGDKIKELFGGVSEYDRSNYDVVPIGYQAGGEHGRKTIYLRLPRDEASRVLSGAVYKLTKLAADAAQGEAVSPGRVAKDIFAIGAGVVPSFSPVIDMTRAWSDYLRGAPPVDVFRNRPIVPDRQWAAGGWASLKPMLQWTIGKTGVLNIVGYNPDADTTTEAVVAGVPVLKSLLKISDYGYTEAQRDQQQAKTEAHAQARVRYADEVVSLQQEHDRLQHLKQQRTPEQARRFLQLRAWDANYRHLDERVIELRDRGNDAAARVLTERINGMGKAVKETLDGRRAESFRYRGPLSPP